MTIPTLSADDQKKLAHFLGEGIKVKQEVADLTEGLNDVKKHLADELDIPVKELGKALTVAFKKLENSEALEDEQATLDAVGEILEITGY